MKFYNLVFIAIFVNFAFRQIIYIGLLETIDASESLNSQNIDSLDSRENFDKLNSKIGAVIWLSNMWIIGSEK